MWWGPFGGDGPGADAGKLVFFAGRTERTVLGMGGSLKHVIGGAGAGDLGSSSSALPFLLESLSKDVGDGIDLRQYSHFMEQAGTRALKVNLLQKWLCVASNWRSRIRRDHDSR